MTRFACAQNFNMRFSNAARMFNNIRTCPFTGDFARKIG